MVPGKERLPSSRDILMRWASPPEGGGGLSQTDVVEPHIFQYGKAAFEYRIIGEELAGLTYGHVQHFRDVQPPIADFEGFVIVALAPAHVAGDVHVGQEVHFHADLTVAAARLAASALDVEAEPPLSVAPALGLLGGGEQIPDVVEQAGVGGWVGAGRPPNGTLVDVHHLVQLLDALDAVALAGTDLHPHQFRAQALE